MTRRWSPIRRRSPSQVGTTCTPKHTLAAVLIFIGAKIFVADFLLGGDKFPPLLSLGVTFALIAVGIFYSLWKTR